MSATLERDGDPTDRVVDFREVIEQALKIYEEQQQLEKAIPLVKDKPRQALCWTCDRSAWQCLCEWPVERWPGMTTRPGGRMDGVRLEVVEACPGFWPG